MTTFVLVFLFTGSVLLPIKAILMNLLATGAALGITVAVFQWGYGESVLGFTSPGQFLNYLILGFVWKTLVEIVIMPLSYALCGFLKRREPTYQQALLAA